MASQAAVIRKHHIELPLKCMACIKISMFELLVLAGRTIAEC